MIHLGDITKIHGDQIPAVDVITGGSPCQDLSVAGKRAGLAGERSGLFMEQMRIVREMRERDRRDGRTGWAIRPRYMVWENVPGAFSSGTPKGADFAAVIEEIIKVAEPGAGVCVCVPEGGWTKSGCYYADDGTWSVAWRVHDAQFWGVPQRRKRIALVADFGGLTAPEILFVRKGLYGDFEPCGETWQGASPGAESGTGSAISFQERAGKPGGAKDFSCRMSLPEDLQPSEHKTYSIQGNTIDRNVKQNGGGYLDRHLPHAERDGSARRICRGLQERDGELTDQRDAASEINRRPGCELSEHCTDALRASGFNFGQSGDARGIGYENEQSPTLCGGGGGNNKPCAVIEKSSV